MTMTFADVPKGPVDPMFDLKRAIESDTSPGKIDLGAGVYRNQEGKYHEFEAIREVGVHVDGEFRLS